MTKDRIFRFVSFKVSIANERHVHINLKSHVAGESLAALVDILQTLFFHLVF